MFQFVFQFVFQFDFLGLLSARYQWGKIIHTKIEAQIETQIETQIEAQIEAQIVGSVWRLCWLGERVIMEIIFGGHFG